MIPELNIDLTAIEEVTNPSLTYKLDLVNKRISGKIDGQEAIMQMVTKTLSTERFACPIYSSDYGVEYERLIGKDFAFVESDAERTTSDAILVDDRMVDISDFSINKTSIDTAAMSFTVNSIEGDISITAEVNIA